MLNLLLLFIIVPLVDLFLLVYIGQTIGFWDTVLIVIATGVFGALLARSEGLFLLQKIQKQLASGVLPEKDLTNGLLLVIGSVLLVTPGVITDITGFLLIMPGSRDLIRVLVMSQMKKRIRVVPLNEQTPRAHNVFDNDNIIDGEGSVK
ncbi:FxsA family protein [Candidatus Uabimicrobium sp. HlEnr_7]|uniref:FxsA family protein n=1 Tax=Candidatus Uabimicrobium helgolandensis TaxID=3095367 RepID=UPI003557FF2A